MPMTQFNSLPKSERLAMLNELRVRAGKEPLKAWKESNEKLAQAFAQLRAALHKEEPKQKRHKAKHNGDFASWCKENKMGQKQARSKLRRHGFTSPYVITPETEAVLKGDARKKKA
jgi:hypothetical protein